ncbi:MAG: RidA family protein [Alphaproteobacteria bacterium]
MRRQHVMSEGLWSMQVEVPYPKAIRCGEMVFTCGQCDLDVDGKPMRPNDLLAQTERTMEYAYGMIGKAGATPRDLTRLQVFYVDDGTVDEDAYVRAIAGMVKKAGVGSLVIVPTPLACFYYPGMVVEIDAVAVVGETPRKAAPSPIWLPAPLAPAVRAGETIHVGGIEPRDEQGAVIAPGDLAVQTDAVFDGLERHLAALGADLADVVKLSIYFTGGREAWDTIAPIRARRFKAPGPIVTDVPLPRLSPQGARIRIEATAMRGRDGKRLARKPLRPGGHWGWPAEQPFVHALQCGDKVFVGGQMPLDARGAVVHPNDVEKQTHRVMGDIKALLYEFGLGFGQVVKTNIFYVGGPTPHDLHANLNIRSTYYAKPGPASTGVPVPALSFPGAMLSVEVLAMTD